MSCFIKNIVFEGGPKIIHHSCTCRPWSTGNRAPSCFHQFVTRRQSGSCRTEPWFIVWSPCICAFVQKSPWKVFSFNDCRLQVLWSLLPSDHQTPCLSRGSTHGQQLSCSWRSLISSGFCWRVYSFYLSSPLSVMISALWPPFQVENSRGGFLSRLVDHISEVFKGNIGDPWTKLAPKCVLFGS